jgi:hypothetical protein
MNVRVRASPARRINKRKQREFLDGEIGPMAGVRDFVAHRAEFEVAHAKNDDSRSGSRRKMVRTRATSCQLAPTSRPRTRPLTASRAVTKRNRRLRSSSTDRCDELPAPWRCWWKAAAIV